MDVCTMKRLRMDGFRGGYGWIDGEEVTDGWKSVKMTSLNKP